MPYDPPSLGVCDPQELSYSSHGCREHPNPQSMALGMQTCLDALAQHVLLLGADGRIAFANRAWREFARPLYAEGTDWIGKPFDQVYMCGTTVDLTARTIIIAQIAQVLGGTLPKANAEISSDRAGTRHWFTVHAEPLPEGGAVLSHYDITQIRSIDQARTRFATLANDSSEYVLLLDAEGKTEYINVAARRLARRLAAEIPAQSEEPELARWTAILAATDALSQARQKGAWRGELTLQTTDGDHAVVKATVQAKGADDGASHYYSVVLHDVSADKHREEELHNRHVELELAYSRLKEAQEQLLQSEKMASIGQLASGVAHEINNPIGYVHSNLGTLQEYTRNLFTLLDGYDRALREQPTLAPEIQRELSDLRQRFDVDFVVQDLPQLLAESREGIERVKKIVQDLKDFSHAGQADEWVLADVHKGLDSTLNIVWNELKYKAEVNKNYAELPLIECLPMQINQVFMNILVNAGHSIKERGTISLASGVEGDHIWVSIADTGEGMPEALVQRIFDPFFTTKPVGKGTGLGLSLSYGIIKKHNGRIEVKSRPGEGSEFRVVLPISQPRNPDGTSV